jgi:phosphoribosylformylglycinamidine synthase
MQPKVLILHAPGTNRDREAAWAIELVGGQPEIVHVNQLHSGARHLRDYQMLVLPGGFAHADALGAGKVLALDLRLRLGTDLEAFIAAGKPVLGICNGFQALVKAGLLPGSAAAKSTLSFNASGHFECRWVTLRSNPASSCVFTGGHDLLLRCPVAHGEGNYIAQDSAALADLEARGQVALRYVLEDGTPARGAYPANPNGSAGDIAGVCNPAGNVFGLMPHPEDHVIAEQHPRWTRGEGGALGLALFESGVQYAREI